MSDVPLPIELISAAISHLGCRTEEIRWTVDKTTWRSDGYRVVVAAPDIEAAYLLAALVEALGAKLEGPPRQLALGIPVPEFAVRFRVPAHLGIMPGLGSLPPGS